MKLIEKYPTQSGWWINYSAYVSTTGTNVVGLTMPVCLTLCVIDLVRFCTN